MEVLASAHRRWLLLPHLVLALFAGLGPFVDPASYTSPVFTTLFDLAAPKVWGVAFLLVAVLCVHTIITWSWHTYRLANVLHLGLCTTWLATLGWGRLVDGYVVSFTAYGLWASAVALCIVLVLRHTPTLRLRERRKRDPGYLRLWSMGGLAAMAAADPVADQVVGSRLDTSSIVVALIGAAAGFGGSVLMFRGKTQDTANWLVKSLREDAEAARTAATVARAEATVARTEAKAAWERVDECELQHAATREYLTELVAGLRRAGVALPELPTPPEH